MTGGITTGFIALDALLAFVINATVFSFVEWGVHRTLMHRKPLPDVFYRSPYFSSVYEHHAILHHNKYYKVYDFEPDPVARQLNIRFQWSDLVTVNVLIAPVHITYWIYNPVGSIVFALMVFGYMFLWNSLHAEMHMPTNRWAFRNRVFRFLNRHHYMHHVHPGRNFNVVLPLPDLVMRTRARPTASEVAAMRCLGLYGDLRGPEHREHLEPIA